MNRSPTESMARFSSLVPAPIHPMQARLLALVAAHRFATTTQLARLTAPEYASPASALRQTQRHLASLAQQRLLTSLGRLARRLSRDDLGRDDSRPPPCGSREGGGAAAAAYP